MKLLTRPTAKQVLNKWKAQYYQNKEWRLLWCDESSKKVYDAIAKLGKAATSKQINKIIGNDSWTAYWCGECKEYMCPVVEFGKEENYNIKHICELCLTKAMQLTK